MSCLCKTLASESVPQNYKHSSKVNLNSVCLKTTRNECKAWWTETASNIWANSITKPDDKVTSLVRSQDERSRLLTSSTQEASKSTIPPGAQIATTGLNMFIAWTGPGHESKWSLPMYWWCSADNDFSGSFTWTWMTQQFTFLLSNSSHPPLLQVLPETLPPMHPPQTPEQQLTDSVFKITKWSCLTKSLISPDHTDRSLTHIVSTPGEGRAAGSDFLWICRHLDRKASSSQSSSPKQDDGTRQEIIS